MPELDARCLLVTATGPVFSAGYDIGNLPREEFADRAEALVAHPFHEAIEALDAYPFPSVAALNGHAIGGGLELALSCDLRVASEDAKLGMPPARLGLIYSHTGLRKFVDAIGAPRTRELFFTARNVTARTALQWGLVNEVVAADEVGGARAGLRGADRRPRAALARAATSARCASCWRPRESSTPRSSASWSRCARRASRARTSSRACAPSPRSARRAGRALTRPLSKPPSSPGLIRPMNGVLTQRQTRREAGTQSQRSRIRRDSSVAGSHSRQGDPSAMLSRLKVLTSQPKLALGALLTLLLAAGAVVGSGADFTATSANPSNTFASGTLTIGNSKEGLAVLSASNLRPARPRRPATSTSRTPAR